MYKSYLSTSPSMSPPATVRYFQYYTTYVALSKWSDFGHGILVISVDLCVQDFEIEQKYEMCMLYNLPRIRNRPHADTTQQLKLETELPPQTLSGTSNWVRRLPGDLYTKPWQGNEKTNSSHWRGKLDLKQFTKKNRTEHVSQKS